jgi:hypothetical protein
MFTPPYTRKQGVDMDHDLPAEIADDQRTDLEREADDAQAEVIIVATGTHADSPVDDDVDQYDDSEEGVDAHGVPVTSVDGSEKDST